MLVRLFPAAHVQGVGVSALRTSCTTLGGFLRNCCTSAKASVGLHCFEALGGAAGSGTDSANLLSSAATPFTLLGGAFSGVSTIPRGISFAALLRQSDARSSRGYMMKG